MGSAQERNTEQVDILSTDFLRSYSAVTHWMAAHSILSLTPGLRGFWPLSSRDESDNAYDNSGQGRTLTNVNNLTYGTRGLVPYSIHTGAGVTYLRRPDEAGLALAASMTVGCWIYFDGLGVLEPAISQFGAAGNRSYRLAKDTNDKITFRGSNDGTATATAVSASAVSAATWMFVAGRFVTNVGLDVYMNRVKASQAVVVANLFNSNQRFSIGESDAGTVHDGRIALPFLCAEALPDYHLNTMFEMTKALFGIR